jgi:hypothetical protein
VNAPEDRVEVRLGHSCRDELHGRALDRLGDRLGVPEVILLSPGIRAHVLRRHYASVVSEHLQLAAEITAAGWPAVPPQAGPSH